MANTSTFRIASLAAVVLTASISPAEDFEARPIFKDGEAQVVDAFKDSKDWIRHHLWVETEFDSDGDGKLDRMHVDVTRPKQTESEGLKVAVIYETSPYYCGTAKNAKPYFWDPQHNIGATPPPHELPQPIEFDKDRSSISKSHVNDWVPRGFAVVHSCSPGTGRSQGCPTVGGDNESLAPKAVIDWLNGRAKGYTTPDGNEEVKATWSTGKVGMTGTSYNGTLPLAAATTGVEGLEAIIPVAPNTSYYHYYRSNGLVRHPGGYMGEDIDVLYNFINSGDPARRCDCDKNVRDAEMIKHLDRVTGDYNSFWAGRDYLNEMGPMKAALLMSHGFNDWNVMPEHSLRIYEAARAKGLPTQIFYHQGGHGGPPPLKMMNRWFTRYLYGVENGVENDPKAWIVREDKQRDEPTSYPDYPNPSAMPVTLYPTRGGERQGNLLLAQPMNQGTELIVDNFSFDGATLAKADWTNHRLLFSTPELSEPVHISGYAEVTITMASDRPAANLSVWLVSLPWDDKGKITDNIITRGWADPQNRDSVSESAPLTPGQFYDVRFRLQPDDQIVAAGQQIGFMVFSTDRDFTLWPDPGTELTVDLDHTSLTLPVVGGAVALEKAFTPKPKPESEVEAD
ncbi:MAG: Xaa-Pro dipeptidyl-peptidase [Planctomycetaceae bacterium]